MKIDYINTAHKGLPGLANKLRTDLNSGISNNTLEIRRQAFDDNLRYREPMPSFWFFVKDAFGDEILQILCVCAIIEISIGLSPFTENPGYDAFDGIGIVFAIAVIVITTAVTNYNKEKKFKQLSDENFKKFKDSKIPKKGRGKLANNTPIYSDPNTHSKIIGTLLKDQEIKWISKTICDEREWVRCDKEHNYGYVIGYEKDKKCNLNLETIKEKVDKNDKIKEPKKLNLVPITKEENEIGKESLKEILEESKKDFNDNESQSISTGMEDNNHININKSDFSDSDSESSSSNNSNYEEKDENWDKLIYEEDVSKIDSVIKENNKLMNELLNQKGENEIQVSNALNSILDVLPGNENLSKDNRLFNALNLIPGGKNHLKENIERKDSFGEDIKKSRTVAPKKQLPKKDGKIKKEKVKSKK